MKPMFPWFPHSLKKFWKFCLRTCIIQWIVCRIELSSHRDKPGSQNQKDHTVNTSRPVNALNNPFNEGDTIVVPVEFEAVLLSPGIPKYLSLETPVIAEVTNVTQPKASRFDKEVFMATVAFRMKDGKQYEGEVTVELLKANEIDTNVLVFA